MKLNIFINSFQNLNSIYLQELSKDKYYSDRSKEELIQELKRIFRDIKSRGVSSLEIKFSKCLYCFPGAIVIEGYHQEELYIRYIVSESEGQYIVQSCKNKIIKDGENGMPF